MAQALRKSQDDFSPTKAALRAHLAVVPSLREERATPPLNASVHVSLPEKAYRALHIGFVAVPIIAGVDKFANVLSDWSHYVAPSVLQFLGLNSSAFIYGLGAFEIMLGMAVALRPKFFADALSAYFVAIILNFLIYGEFLDIALLTIALAAGACALGRLSTAREEGDFRGLDDEFATPVRHRRAS
jgi:hypothetical protein